MSDLIDIKDIRKSLHDKMSLDEWKKFAEAQNHLIDSFQYQIKLLKEKNDHLQSLLMKKESLVYQVAPEEKICIEQIDRLEKVSTDRQLTLEEVKRLDLLVKNLKLIREESTIVVNNKNPENYKENDLVAIVAQSESDS